jgi:hypothetical protein
VKAAKKRALNKKDTERKTKGVERKGESVQDRTYGNFDTTIFDVRRDFIQLLNDMKGGSPTPKIPGKRVVALRTIAHESRQRMNDANLTLPETMADLEAARLKLADIGGAGTIASLVTAIRLKKGGYCDERWKKPLALVYE